MKNVTVTVTTLEFAFEPFLGHLSPFVGRGRVKGDGNGDKDLKRKKRQSANVGRPRKGGGRKVTKA